MVEALGFTTNWEQVGTKKVATGWRTVYEDAGFGQVDAVGIERVYEE